MNNRLVRHVATTLILASAVTVFGCRSPMKDVRTTVEAAAMAQTDDKDVRKAVPIRVEDAKDSAPSKGKLPVIEVPEDWVKPPKVDWKMKKTPHEEAPLHH